MNKIINVTVNGQSLTAGRLDSVKGTMGLIEIHFSFDEYWGNFPIRKAYFKNSDQAKSYVKNIWEEKCMVPAEVLCTKGIVSMAVEGTNEEGQVERTSTAVIIRQVETLSHGCNSINPTPNQYTQFVKDVDDKLKIKADSLNYHENSLDLLSGEEVLSSVELNNGLGRFAYESLSKVSDWLYEVTYSNCDYDYAYNYMESHFIPTPAGACSAVYKDGLLGKNFDWYYSWNLDFVVRSKASDDRFASLAVMGGFPPFTKQLLESDEYTDDFKLIPFMVTDGVNERGVWVALNIVPFNETKHGESFCTPTTGTNPESTGRALCALMLPKVILDNYSSAEEAVEAIENTYNIYATATDNLKEEYHLMIGDSEKQFIVEFINNETQVTEVTDNLPWMTNFYRYEAEFDSEGMVDYHTLTDHAMGVERSNIIAENYGIISNANDMISLMSEDLRYTNAYVEPWLDELCGNYPTYGDLTITDVYEHPEKFNEVLAIFRDRYQHRNRDNADTWLSAHSCTYDFNKGLLYIIVQEDGVVYKFNINGSDLDEGVWERGTGEHSVQTKDTVSSAEGHYSVAEGFNTLAKSDYSHTEGWATRTILDPTDTESHGHASHAEGSHTIAKGTSSHAEGNTTESIGWYSHAEGSGSVAGGISSHAEGDGTITNNYAEHAEGSFNKSNQGASSGDNTLHSIGIGTSMLNRRNAIEVMQNGDQYIIGVGGYDGTNYNEATTLQELLNNIPSGGQAVKLWVIALAPWGNDDSVTHSTCPDCVAGDYLFFQGNLYVVTEHTGTNTIKVRNIGNVADGIGGAPYITCANNGYGSDKDNWTFTRTQLSPNAPTVGSIIYSPSLGEYFTVKSITSTTCVCKQIFKDLT